MGDKETLGSWNSDPAKRFKDFDLAAALGNLTQGLMDAQNQADTQLVKEFGTRDEAPETNSGDVRNLLDMGLSPNRFLVKEADFEIQTEFRTKYGASLEVGFDTNFNTVKKHESASAALKKAAAARADVGQAQKDLEKGQRKLGELRQEGREARKGVDGDVDELEIALAEGAVSAQEDVVNKLKKEVDRLDAVASELEREASDLSNRAKATEVGGDN